MIHNPGTRRVLLVTSSYWPTMIADMHRVRHLAWELPKLGWDVEILHPNVEFQRPEYLDPASAFLFNPGTVVHAVPPCGAWLFRLLEMRTIGWRALWPLRRAGAALLARKKFDLVYITTASFVLFCLGRHWRRAFGVPYVLDYHDPWVRAGVQYRNTRHTLKLKIVTSVFPRMERYALRDAAGVVSVSPAYLDELRRRYGSLSCLEAEHSDTIPFAGSEHDLIQPSRPPAPSRMEREVIYVGAGGPIMAESFSAICEALAQLRIAEPDLLASLKIRAFGTHSEWTEGDPKPFEDIARRFGLSDVIEEHPARITYVKAMELADRSDGLLVLGVDDSAYMPSKLFNYALTGRPLLACLRGDSPPTSLFEQMQGLGNLMTFGGGAARALHDSAAPMRTFLDEVNRCQRFDRRDLLADYLSPAMARRHISLFERVLSETAAA